MQLRQIDLGELEGALFLQFQRHQVVTQCLRKVDGAWCVQDIAFVEDWTTENHAYLAKCLRNTITCGGVVFGAFCAQVLKGFASVESARLGSNEQYMELSSLHVSQDMRGQGVGKALFGMAKIWAREQGAQKLYISTHSAVETQAFYKAMGCVEAQEDSAAHVEKEPCDCQLECLL